jgi:hypothetical protein
MFVVSQHITDARLWMGLEGKHLNIYVNIYVSGAH